MRDTVRELEYEELPQAEALLWNSYYETEKHTAPLRAMEHFRDATSAVSLSVAAFTEGLVLFGEWDGAILRGVGGVLPRENRILLLFVLPEEQKKGIGSALLTAMEVRCTGEVLRVNASLTGKPFYEKKGFVAASCAVTDENGAVTVPMEKIKKR